MFGVMQNERSFWHFMIEYYSCGTMCAFYVNEVLCRNKYQGIFLSLRILVISA